MTLKKENKHLIKKEMHINFINDTLTVLDVRTKGKSIKIDVYSMGSKCIFKDIKLTEFYGYYFNY